MKRAEKKKPSKVRPTAPSSARAMPDTAMLRRLSVAASCDPRTIAAVLEGRSVRGLSRERAVAALTKAGFTLPFNPPSTSPPAAAKRTK